MDKLLDITSSNSIVAIRLKEAITEKGLKQTSIANRAGYNSARAKRHVKWQKNHACGGYKFDIKSYKRVWN